MSYYVSPRGMSKTPRLFYSQGGHGPKLLRDWKQLTLDTHFLLRAQQHGGVYGTVPRQ